MINRDIIQIILICLFILLIIMNKVSPTISVVTQGDIEKTNLSGAIKNISHEEKSEPTITPTFIFWR
ncbi:MAG: hypothetical protein J7K31_00040 [Candidatus Aenigmarchaeota archaeon]|nr:hypothetical protein [Candidatus Aenigmarchaeota archaeon]